MDKKKIVTQVNVNVLFAMTIICNYLYFILTRAICFEIADYDDNHGNGASMTGFVNTIFIYKMHIIFICLFCVVSFFCFA